MRAVRQPISRVRAFAPGMITFAVTPYAAISVAAASVNASTPAFAAV